MRDVSFASALKLLLRQVGLTYIVDDDYILITVPGKEPSAEAPKTSSAQEPNASVPAGEASAAVPLPTVRVTQPVVCDVCDYEEYTGRIEGRNDVSILAPQKGLPVYECRRNMIVKKGDVLAEIVAKDDWAKVKEKAEALNRLSLTVPRGGRGAGTARPSNAEAEEQWKSALAEWNRASGSINTVKILAPCSGNVVLSFAMTNRLGRGNVADETPAELEVGRQIAGIVTSDSMVVTFDVPEQTVLAHRRIPDRKPNWELSLPVVFGLADEKGFPYRGEITSVATGIDPSTHAQRWQAIVPNKDGIFLPGMSVRVRVITSEPHKATVIPRSAVLFRIKGNDYENYVYVLSDRNALERRPVKCVHNYDGLQAIEGLTPSSRVASDADNDLGRWAHYNGNSEMNALPVDFAVNPEKVTTPPPAWAAVSVPPAVTVAHPIVREVTDYAEFVGHIEAAQTVDLRALVSGTLDKVNFKPGQTVKQGDVLFEIDPRLYQAELDKAAAGMKQAQIHLDQKTKDVARLQELLKSAAISQGEYDHVVSERDEAAAAVKTAEAAYKVARVHLEFTRISAPITGKIGRSLLDVGNIVTAEKTILARLDSTDPMHLCFDIDERTVLAIRRAPAKFLPSVSCSIGDEQGYPHEAKFDSIDSQMNAATGTLRCRAVLPNKGELFVPGMFARVRVGIGPPHNALLIPETALQSDQGKKFVFVVSEQNVVERRDVENGPMQDKELRVIAKGLTGDDWVVVSDAQRLKPGTAVTAEKSEVKTK
jgi:RND family efflux transporter MFP subunit